MTALVTKSDIDSGRFGVKIARTSRLLDSLSDVDECMKICRSVDEPMDMIVARIDCLNLDVVHHAIENGYMLMDTLVYYKIDVKGDIRAIRPCKYNVREMKATEIDAVAQVSKVGFNNFFGHYHADKRLDRDTSTICYWDWARNTATESAVADSPWFTVVAEDDDGLIVGFLSARDNGDGIGEIVLNAVHKDYEKKGIYRSMVNFAVLKFKSMGFNVVTSSTQIQNLGVQKVWSNQGLVPVAHHYTFHKWFDGEKSGKRRR